MEQLPPADHPKPGQLPPHRPNQPQSEQRRLAAVSACGVLDTPRESAFDNIVFVAAQLFRVPMAKLTVVAENRVWLKASVGRFRQNIPRTEAFCPAVIERGELLVVEDALSDNRFTHLPMVATDPHIRFYAGVPLHGPERQLVGTLSVLDTHPRSVPERARNQLLQLALEAETLLNQRASP